MNLYFTHEFLRKAKTDLMYDKSTPNKIVRYGLSLGEEDQNNIQ
jgi:hypothetical protein